MNVKFEAKFAKDLRAIKNAKHLDKIKEIINACKSAHDISELSHIKKSKARIVFIVFAWVIIE